MKSWARTILPVFLVCYIAASSIAAAHAFTSPLGGESDAPAIMNIEFAMEMPLDCHQQQNLDSDSLSACEIFCSIMSNIIENENIAGIQATKISTQIHFAKSDFHNFPFVVEPRPPK